MKKHITIILFDTSDEVFDENIVNEFERKLINTQLHEDSVIFYLKIPKKNEPPQHQIFKYANGGEGVQNTRERIWRNYNFKDYLSLRKCVDFLRRQIPENRTDITKNRWYFVCIGHGYGYTFFNYDNDPARTRSSYDYILYAPELANAFSSLNLTLSLFNTCNFLLLENCRFFSTKTKYLIGTENYTSIKFLDIAEYIILLNDRINSSLNSYRFSRSLYERLLNKRDEIIAGDLENSFKLKGASIFMLDLETHFHNIFNVFNKVSHVLLQENFLGQYKSWYQSLRESIANSDDMSYIDLLDFVRKLSETFPEDKLLSDSFQIIKQEMAAIRCHETPTVSGPKNSLSGISVYLPAFGSRIDYHYERFRTKFPYYFKDLKWNFFVNKIVEKTI